jgi:3-phenylpropionate/trans-cinnamate dioxygenase ferredoxin reductase component
MNSGDFLAVVGGGQAGAELAVQARECGWLGRIALIGDELVLPYQRPPLSKAYLAGDVRADGLALKSRAAYEKAGVDLLLGKRVAELDRARTRLLFEDGSAMAYSHLALCTGGRPRRLQAAAHGAEGAGNFHYLRTLADVDRIRGRFAEGGRVAIVGGGYIGLEVAAVAVQHGLKVVVLEAESRVLARVTAPRVSEFYEQVHGTAGVEVRTGVQVEGFAIDRDRNLVTEVICSGGEHLPTDLVVAGVGLVPNTELAAAAGLAVDDGVLVDACSRTDDPSIVAAGDCARTYSALYGRSIRLESVPNALEQARSAAATLCGTQRRHEAVPWFWSDQYDLRLKMAGLASGYERIVLRGSFERKSFSVFYLTGRRVLAVDTVNRPLEFMLSKRLVGEGIELDDEQLADDAVPLKSLLPTAAAAAA